MKKFNVVIAACCIFALLPGCGLMMKKKVANIEAIQSQPVNHQTAKHDIKVLEAEKANVAKQMAAGVTSILPPSLIMGILTGSASAKYKIATGTYNKMIDERIAKIKRECNIK